MVSVPSRGILFPNIQKRYRSNSSLLASFRPLSGYLISKYQEKLKLLVTIQCFRPLSGYLISKYKY